MKKNATLNWRVGAAAIAMACAPFAADSQELPVGAIGTLTGAYAFGGVPIQNGIRLAFEEANRDGFLGAAKIKMIEGDTAGDKGQALNLVNQLGRRDKVLMILGPGTSPEALAIAPLGGELKIPTLSQGSSRAILAAGPYSFKFQMNSSDIMGSLAKYLAQKAKMKRMGIIFDRGSDGYIENKSAFVAYAKENGISIVSEEGIQATDSNFLAIATKLAEEDIDGVFVAATSELVANIAIQMRQAGVEKRVVIVGPASLSSPNYIKTGGSAVEGSLFVADYFIGSPGEKNKAFISLYTNRYKTPPDNYAAMGYSAAQVVLLAIKNAGPNPTSTQIRDELAKLKDVPVLIGSGKYSFGADRVPYYGTILLTVKNGQFALAE